jgi:hypothetical protein
MEKENKPLEIGNLVGISHGGYHRYKIIGFSEGGSLAFLQPISFLDRSRNEHAISWLCNDLVKVS